jgi:glycosyltransferase domain-containing protein
MLENLCLIIPSHNRPEYITRIVAYLGRIEYPGDVCICDSSVVPWSGDLPLRFKYRHLAGMSFPEKILSVVADEPHELFVLCPVDDFIILPSVFSGYSFLKNDSEYCCYTGGYYDYSKEDRTGEIFQRVRSIPRCISHNDPVVRAADLMLNYHMMLWNMFRRDVLVNAFKGVQQAQLSNDNFIELILSVTAVLEGSVKIDAVPWMVRERSEADDCWGKRHVPLSRARANDEAAIRDDYRKAAEYFEITYGTLGRKVWDAGVESYFEMLNPLQLLNITRRLVSKAFWRVMRVFGASSRKRLICPDQKWAENAEAIRRSVINGFNK